MAGEPGGLFWVQDFSLEGQPLAEVRTADLSHANVVVEIEGLAAGSYAVRPYDTQQGIYLDDLTLTCAADLPCTLALPPFTADMAFKILR